MGFRTFAYGLPDFHYTEARSPDGGDFDTIKLLATLQTMEPSKMGVVGAVADQTLPSAGITDLISAVANQEFMHMLIDSVSFIAMSPNADGAHISLTLTVKRKLWVDQVTFNKYDFTPGDSPGVEFVHAISKNLKETGFDNWGTLRSLRSYWPSIGIMLNSDARRPRSILV